MSRFVDLFGKKPVIGMIHLGGGESLRIKRALEELTIFEEEGLQGAIIENYHGTYNDVVKFLKEITENQTPIHLGINILPNEFEDSFELARRYGAKFIQLDYVAGRYEEGMINAELYEKTREKFRDLIVLGGVWPKYYTPIEGSHLDNDIHEGMRRCDALVVTGKGTGKITPIDKINYFRQISGDFPLVIGAGANPENIEESLRVADGVIIGSSLKEEGKTHYAVSRSKVREFIAAVERIRR